MHLLRSAFLITGVWLMLAGVCFGKQVYLKDGSAVQCESFWKSGGQVLVKVNRDILLRFEPQEVDMKRTFRSPVKKVRPAVTKRHAAALPTVITPSVAEAAPSPIAKAAAALPPTAPVAGVAAPAPKPSPAPPTPSPAPKETVRPEGAQPNPSAADAQSVSPEGSATQKVVTSAAGSMTFLLVLIGLILVGVISMWRVFEKAGEKGIYSIIPIYNMFVLMEISGKPWWWMLLLFVPVIGVVVGILAMIALAQRFGRGLLFGLGLSFLPMFFFPLLAFGNAQYER